MANDLISRKALIADIRTAKGLGSIIAETIVRFLRKQPTVDAVEVVRCKDCKYWKCWRISGEGSGDCCLDVGYATLATQHYDFCSYGERKDNELLHD